MLSDFSHLERWLTSFTLVRCEEDRVVSLFSCFFYFFYFFFIAKRQTAKRKREERRKRVDDDYDDDNDDECYTTDDALSAGLSFPYSLASSCCFRR